jgi:type I restriction enzyme S subunit
MVDERNVPEGYKLTEVGVIPEDWAHVTLKELTNMIGDGIHTTPKYVSNSDFYFINGNNLGDKKIIIYSDTKCVSKIEYEKHKEKLNEKSLLMSINGTIGNLSFYNNEKVILGKSACYMNIKTSILRSYVYYQLQTNNVMKFYDYEMTGSTIRNLSLKSIRNTPIPVPANEVEQKSIAEALSDTDNLILSLEKLIDKKNKIKQGAMQQLMTGKKRLPGFSGEWEVKKLGEIADVYQPKTISESDFTEDGYLVYGANGIVGRYSFYNHEKWQVTITCRGSTCGTVNKTKEKSWITGNAMVVNLDNNNKVSKMFIYYFLRSYDFKNYITGSGQPQIVRGPLLTLEIKLPTVEEQKAIAQVLSDMDLEIEALEEKLEKVKTIKQGMMQELLTGRIRLI